MQKEYAQKIIDATDSRDEFVTDVDGFVYWWPQNGNGHLSAEQLRILADELDKRNKHWQQVIDNYFESNATGVCCRAKDRRQEKIRKRRVLSLTL